MPEQNMNVMPMPRPGEDELFDLMQDVKSQRGSFKNRIKNIDARGIAAVVEGTVFELLERIVTAQASLRDGILDAIEDVEERIAGDESPPLSDEDSAKLTSFIAKALKLCELVKEIGMSDKLLVAIEEIEKLGAECKEIVEANSGEDDPDDNGDGDEPEQPETDGASLS